MLHSEYALLANVIVAAESATFHDLPHFGGGIVPGDGIFTAWSYPPPEQDEPRLFLLNPQPFDGTHGPPNGELSLRLWQMGRRSLERAELADLYLKVPEVTRRNNAGALHSSPQRAPCAGSGLRPGARREHPAADLVKSMQSGEVLQTSKASKSHEPRSVKRR